MRLVEGVVNTVDVGGFEDVSCCEVGGGGSEVVGAEDEEDELEDELEELEDEDDVDDDELVEDAAGEEEVGGLVGVL